MQEAKILAVCFSIALGKKINTGGKMDITIEVYNNGQKIGENFMDTGSYDLHVLERKFEFLPKGIYEKNYDCARFFLSHDECEKLAETRPRQLRFDLESFELHEKSIKEAGEWISNSKVCTESVTS